MKPSPSLRRLLLASALLATASSAHAQLYWDNNADTAGFGTASGTWGIDAFWNTDASGGAGSFSTVTTTSDSVSFGTATDGLAAGTITVDGTVDSGNMTFGSASGLITLSGGTINFAPASTITVNNATNTLSSAISGAATSLTKAGTGTLVLSGGGTMAGNLVVAGGTVQLGADNGISTSAGLEIHGGTAATRVFDLNGYNQTLSRFGFSAINSDGNLTITGGANSTLTINATGNTLLGQSGTSTNPITPARTFFTDMSGLGGFVWNGGSAYYFEVGPRGSNRTGGEFNPGTATVVLADHNTITGTQIRVGANAMNNHGGTSTLRLGQTNLLNAGTINIGASSRSNATLNFRDGLSGSPTVTLRGTDGSSAVTLWDVGRVAAVSSPTTWTSTVDLSAGEVDALVTSLRIGRADTGGSTNRGGILNASFTMGDGTLEVGTLLIGQYAGGGSLGNNYAGHGTFTLNDAGGIVRAQTITLADNTGTATNGPTRASTSGTFNLTAGTLEAISIDKGADTGNAGAVTRNFNFTSGTIRNLAGNNLTIANVPLNLTGSGTRIFEATAGRSITVASTSVISGIDQGFTKTGDGTLILAATNTYTGATHVNAGILQLNSTGALDGTSAINLGTTTGGTLQMLVSGTSLGAPITLANTGVTSSISSNSTTSGEQTFTINGAIAGNGNLQFTTHGSGVGNPANTYILGAASTYAGTTTINVGNGGNNVLVVSGVENALPTTTVLAFGNTAGAGTGRRHNFDLNGFSQTLGGLESTAASFRIQRVNNTSATAATLTINDDGNRTFRGMLGSDSVGGGFDLTSGNNFSVVKNGTGTWTLVPQTTSGATNSLAAPNSYTGGTILNAGGITLGNGATLGTGSLQVNNTHTGAGTNVLLTLPTGSDLTVGSLSGTLATPASGINTATIATQSGRTFTVNQTADGTYDGVITGAGGFSLGTDSTHALTLSAENTYSGATTVSAGTLYVTGVLTNSAVTVAGNGIIGRNDNTPGGGRLGNGLTIEAGGKLDLTGATLGLSSTDILSLTGGSLTLGALTFQDLHGWDWFNAAPGTYQLIDGSFSVDFGDTAYLSEATAYDFGNGKSGYFTSGSLNAVIIPEPGAALLGGLGLLALLRRRR